MEGGWSNYFGRVKIINFFIFVFFFFFFFFFLKKLLLFNYFSFYTIHYILSLSLNDLLNLIQSMLLAGLRFFTL
jgi:hypothetical protein